MRRQWHPLFVVLMGIAVFGFFHQLLTDPWGFFSNILLFAFIIFLFVAIYQYMTNNRGYGRGKKQHHHRPSLFTKTQDIRKGKSHPATSRRNRGIKKRRNDKEHPFKVIEGNKGKKKKPSSS